MAPCTLIDKGLSLRDDNFRKGLARAGVQAQRRVGVALPLYDELPAPPGPVGGLHSLVRDRQEGGEGHGRAEQGQHERLASAPRELPCLLELLQLRLLDGVALGQAPDRLVLAAPCLPFRRPVELLLERQAIVVRCQCRREGTSEVLMLAAPLLLGGGPSSLPVSEAVDAVVVLGRLRRQRVGVRARGRPCWRSTPDLLVLAAPMFLGRCPPGLPIGAPRVAVVGVSRRASSGQDLVLCGQQVWHLLLRRGPGR
mmetsp:Transcript_110783/g.357570  ORF Transcript_110783/g.357570 Transcript_110783/m.357570 type:complete len:254 (+) Transcript_110783:121-882(+)